VDEGFRVLLIDDDPHFRRVAVAMLEAHGHRVTEAGGLGEVPAGDRDLSAILVDWQLGEHDGLLLVPTLRERFPGVPVVLVTAHATTEVAVEAIKAGAFDFLPKPLDEPRLLSTVAAAAGQRRLLRRLEDLEQGGFEGMLGASPAMRQVFQTIDAVARTDASVLITGESGTGKELVARAVHARSGRRGEFVALNMAAIPRDLVESTLFGYERGAFSGADKRRVGACERAHQGTLFLDEIGEMPEPLQAKLLRFLQEGTVQRVGGGQEVAVDARVVAATNRAPRAAVEEGRLRADLYYRLNVVPVALPPLRERRGDVALLATHALQQAARRFGKSFRALDPAAIRRLEGRAWPGNVRELVHTIERAVILSDGEALLAHMLPEEEPPIGGGAPAAAADERAPPAPPLADGPHDRAPPAAGAPDPAAIIPLAELERQAIEHALAACDGNRADAAERLGISQATIYRKLKAYR